MSSLSLTQDANLRPIRIWLYLLAALVAIMVLVGGATRLTDSGLSITEWAPISGVLPPFSQADWEAAFAAYQTTTEFQTINRDMVLETFKPIFWWEWGHRFLGRFIGLVAVLPLAWFWLSGRLPQRLKLPLVVLVALGGLQGFIGWWMVRSGLVGRVDVSQLRLAVHLTLACIILAYTIWIARSAAVHTQRGASRETWQAAVLTVAILVQIFLGGLVAGLDAGMVHNTWPTMGGNWVPDGLGAVTPWWRDITDNAVTAQFVHRCFAYLLWAGALLHAFHMVRNHQGTTHARRAVLLAVFVTVQAIVGIATLLAQVPMSWALLHQAGAVVVLGFAAAHWHALNPAMLANNAAKPAPAAMPTGAYGRA